MWNPGQTYPSGRCQNFDQATQICEDGDGDSVQSDGKLLISNDKVSQQEAARQIQSLMDMLSQQRFTQVYEQAQGQRSNILITDPLEHNGLNIRSKRAARPSSFCL